MEMAVHKSLNSAFVCHQACALELSGVLLFQSKKCEDHVLLHTSYLNVFISELDNTDP